MLKPYVQSQPALSVNLIFQHFATLNGSEQRAGKEHLYATGCSSPSKSLLVKRHKQMGAIKRFHHTILSLCIGYPKDLDGWRKQKKTVTYREIILLFLSTGSRGLYTKS